jgi:ABC-type transport system involved in multi-copper enzyme maturation permease subunit
MNARIAYIASNTFREAVRDRVLYNLIAFALLLSGAAIFVGQISIEIEKLVVINLGLTAVSLFGVVIAIFIGIGLVSKEIEKRTLYTVLSRPVRRWEFIIGKFFGLAGTLVVNTFFMAIGVFGALLYVAHKFTRPDALIFVALYFIVLQFLIICALALLFSSFSSPLLSAVFAFSLFVIGSFAEDLRGFAGMAHGLTRWLATGAAYLVPNFSAFNVISSIAHEHSVAGQLILHNTIYALFYAAMALSGAILIFEHRNLK